LVTGTKSVDTILVLYPESAVGTC